MEDTTPSVCKADTQFDHEYLLSMCHKYRAHIYQDTLTYSNPHCAMCSDLTLFWNSPTSEALYQVTDALTTKYRGEWPRLVHLSADYARDSGTTTMFTILYMRVKGNNIYRAIVLSTLLYGAERGLDSVQTTGEKAACLHDATSAFDHEDNLDGQSDKQGNTRTDRAAIYGRSSDQKESPVDWTPHEDVNRQATKAGSLLSTVFCDQKTVGSREPAEGKPWKEPASRRTSNPFRGGGSLISQCFNSERSLLSSRP